MRTSAWLPSWVLVLACGPEVPGEATSAASSLDSTSDPGQTSAQSPTTTAPQDPTTDDASTCASSSDATTTASTGTTVDPPLRCVPETDWNGQEHLDCLKVLLARYGKLWADELPVDPKGRV